MQDRKKEDQKESGWKLKDHSRSYNKAKHSCTRRSYQSCQRKRDAVLHCATQLHCRQCHCCCETLLQNPVLHFPVLHFPALQNGPPFSVLPFKSLSCTVRTMTRVICGAIVASHGCRLSFCSGLTTVTQGWPVSGRQLSTSPTRGDVHPLKLF